MKPLPVESVQETAKKARRAGVWLLLVMLLAAPLASVWGVMRLGYWLMVEDPLEPARAIVVLSGHIPFRAIEAARTYQRGLAPEVWLTHGGQARELAALKSLDIVYVPEETYNRRILERMGVPGRAVRLLDGEARNTAEELLLISREVRKAGGARVILVTSKPHTRRVKAIWRALVAATPEAEIRYPPEDSFDPGGWWRSTEDALDVSREFFGLLNVWAGFPVQPRQKR